MNKVSYAVPILLAAILLFNGAISAEDAISGRNSIAKDIPTELSSFPAIEAAAKTVSSGQTQYASPRFFKDEASLKAASGYLVAILDKAGIGHGEPQTIQKGNWLTYSMAVNADIKYLAAPSANDGNTAWKEAREIFDSLLQNKILALEIGTPKPAWIDDPTYSVQIAYIADKSLNLYQGLGFGAYSQTANEAQSKINSIRKVLEANGAKVIHAKILPQGRICEHYVLYSADWALTPLQDSYARYVNQAEAAAALSKATTKLAGIDLKTLDSLVEQDGGGFHYQAAVRLAKGKKIRASNEYGEYKTKEETELAAQTLAQKKEKLGWTVLGYSVIKNDYFKKYMLYMDAMKVMDK